MLAIRGMDSWFKHRRESGMSNSTIDSGYSGSVDSTNGHGNIDSPTKTAQMYGIMQKKPFGHQSTRWSRRFFMLKEGFLLYYGETEKKAYETKGQFNIHPKGVIPLGNCFIEDIALPGMPYCINIKNTELKLEICVAAEDEEGRKKWIKAMDKATKVTTENTGLSETMIKSLQEQSLQLARERQEYVDKFINEAEQHGAEKELREALEEFNHELEEENARIEDMLQELTHVHDQVKNDLEEAVESSKKLECDRAEMQSKTEELQRNLEELSNERGEIIKKLKDHEAKAEFPAEKNAELARQLADIEEKAMILEKDKDDIRKRLEENQRMSKDLLQEREAICLEAEELKSEIQHLSEEKKTAERNLKEEMVARMELQKELEECKAALKRLEMKALNNMNSAEPQSTKDKDPSNASSDTTEMDEKDDSNEQIMRDVKSLREFFENCARDNNIEETKSSPSTSENSSPTNSKGKGTAAEKAPSNDTPSPSRNFIRVATMRRRPQTVRCKSMVMEEDFSISALVRDPSHRRSLLLSRHKRSMSMSGSKKSSVPKKAEEF